MVLIQLITAFLIAVIWSLVDKLKAHDRSPLLLIIVLLRYYLGFILFTYGFSKVFYLQFPELNLMNLTVTYGNSSPMGLLWKFIGYSEAYSNFTGIMEVFGGCLLMFRKTKQFGAILALAVMLNVFMLNMSFDVPVKLFSFHLCIISLVILIPDYKNIFRFFVLNKPTQPIFIENYFKENNFNWIAYVLKTLLVCHVLYGTIDAKLNAQKQYGKRAPSNSLHGIYDVQIFTIKGDTLSPLTSDDLRWKQLIIDKKNSLHYSNVDNTNCSP